jgi:hypothetical protein
MGGNMRKTKIFIALLALAFASAIIFKFFYAPDNTRSARITKPERGLGYHRPDEAYSPGAGIKNSPHDLSADSTYPGSKRYNPEGETNICVFCHLPHEPKKDSGIADIPLWNHASSTVIHFNPYDSGPDGPADPNRRLSADVSRGPGGASLFCLGCHDGTVAVNRYGSLSGNVFISESYKVGANGVLSNHHPIGFEYAGVRDKEIDAYATLGSHSIDDLLSKGRMECTTCHDVHNKGNSGEKLLWVSDRNSNLCCSCHLKCSTK